MEYLGLCEPTEESTGMEDHRLKGQLLMLVYHMQLMTFLTGEEVFTQVTHHLQTPGVPAVQVQMLNCGKGIKASSVQAFPAPDGQSTEPKQVEV